MAKKHTATLTMAEIRVCDKLLSAVTRTLGYVSAYVGDVRVWPESLVKEVQDSPNEELTRQDITTRVLRLREFYAKIVPKLRKAVSKLPDSI